MIRYWWVGLIILGAGFLVGRASVPEPDLRRADSLDVTEPGHDAGRDSTRKLADSLKRISDAADRAAADSARVARQARRAGARAVARAAALEDSLVRARTATDSLPILVTQKAELSQAVDSLQASSDQFEAAYQREKFSRELLVTTVERQERQITADSLRLAAYRNTVMDLRKAVQGCRIPFTKWKCPGVSATWDVNGSGADLTPDAVNVTYPVAGPISVGVSYRTRR